MDENTMNEGQEMEMEGTTEEATPATEETSEESTE